MKTFKITMLAAAVGVAFAASSFASLTAPTFFTLSSELGNPSAEAAYISANFNGGNPVTFLTKEQGGSFSGAGDNPALANGGAYITVVDNGNNTNTITWNLTGSGFTLNFILVKDGTNTGGQFEYAEYGVTADQTTIGFGTVQVDATAGHSISHISFFGNPGAVVPDSGMTVALLGMSLAGIEVLRRRIALKR